ncbi:MAG: iron-containing alcohol dehydrogenase [Phycisphaerales bacterium]|jgi:alcohol dehydrogenase|nr:iron-containing alcohol dehydrogenase [Phycisphaerales bacterium]MBT7171408.1 iron-containing alcohol dehydrogenase [Phycisphaerales bacterium]
MTELTARAGELLRAHNPNYVFGAGCIQQLGGLVANQGRSALVIISGLGSGWATDMHATVRASLDASGVVAGEWVRGSAPNSPFEDIVRLADEIAASDAEVIVSVGGGSGIDAAKTALAYATLRDHEPNLQSYFGIGTVSAMLDTTGRTLRPLVVCELASASASHLTKYACSTDVAAKQKFIIIDPAFVPAATLFDYAMTTTMPREFTMDGALDGVAHCLEVFLGIDEAKLAAVREVALTGIELLVANLPNALENPADLAAREALALGTDLGGVSIMTGGTNGAHLTSFSLVDILPHGRACALLNPYYTIFFAPAVEPRLRDVGAIYQRCGYIDAATDLSALAGRELGLVVAGGMLALSRRVGFPTTLREVEGFCGDHITRCLSAAKLPALASKLQNMPIALTVEDVDEYLGGVLAAATDGDTSLIRTP